MDLDVTPDPDGRYRVNELFCSDETWQDAVRKLLDSSEAVVVDLREYSAERRGTRWELQMLQQRGALARTVLLIGERTDLGDVAVALGLPGVDALRDAVGLVDLRTEERDLLVKRLLRRLPETPLPRLRLEVALPAGPDERRAA